MGSRGPRTREQTLSRGLIIVAVVVVAALFVKLVEWTWPPPEVPLFADAQGLVLAQTKEEAEAAAGHPILMPQDLLGSEVYQIGVYTQSQDGIVAGSTVVVLARNGWRFVDILQRPEMTMKRAMAAYAGLSAQDVVISESVEGKLVTLPRAYIRCVPGHDDIPGACRLTQSLVFVLGDTAVTLSADGDHATEGELIALARSMADAIVVPAE